MKANKLKVITRYPLWLLIEYIDYTDRVILDKEMPLGFLTWAEIFTSVKDFEKIQSLPIPKELSA